MSHTPHTVFISQMFPPEPGGNASRIHDLAVNVANEGVKVTVLAPHPSMPAGMFPRRWDRTTVEDQGPVTVRRFWTWQPSGENPGLLARLPYFVIFGIHVMFWLLRHRGEYDVVITSTPPISTGAPGLLASLLGTPWIVDVRDRWIDASIALGYLTSGSLIERISRRFQSLVLHRADRITVTTESLGADLDQAYGPGLGPKMRTLPNGVDLARFVGQIGDETGVSENERSEPIAQIGDGPPGDGHFSEENNVIIYTGNLGSAQDLETCVRAMDRFDPGEARLVLVGDGDRAEALERLVDELELHDRVAFHEPVPRETVPQYLRAARVGIAPLRDAETLSYAIPTKVYEYLACELPVVVTGTGEIERFVRRSGGGIHADNDPEQIEIAIRRLLDDASRHERCARQGGRFVQHNYDRKAIAADLLVEIQALANSNGD